MSILRTVALSGLILSLSAAQALAHAALVSSAPAAGAAVAPTGRIELHFSEALVEKFSGAEVSSTRMMMGEDFALHQALPQFFFHVTSAYAILRHNGVELAKRDFMGDVPRVKNL